MSEQSEVKTPQQPILPWHREAAKEIDDNPFTQEAAELAAIIARHDPHAETLRLLERAADRLFTLNEVGTLHAQISAHLAAHGGGK